MGMDHGPMICLAAMDEQIFFNWGNLGKPGNYPAW
jgi:hypothetical protein